MKQTREKGKDLTGHIPENEMETVHEIETERKEKENKRTHTR